MKPRILVAYASKHGATQEIAETVADELRTRGLNVDCEPVTAQLDPAPYAAIVLGSAVYIGQWRSEAARFLEKQADLLSQRPVWLFSSGPTGVGDPEALMQGWRFPEKLQPLADRIGPQDIHFFHGALDPQQLNFLEKTAIKAVRAPTGDFRDWEDIRHWAASIATHLSDNPPAS